MAALQSNHSLIHISWLIVALTLVCLPPSTDAGIFDYFLPDRGAANRHASNALENVLPAVPYELAATDEQFIREGAKLIGIGQLSGLDMCHQRVVLTLQKSCADMNAEQMGKLAVMLLNCQSDSEARPLFPCTDAMSLQQCTEPMDANTWNAYHLVTNRAKAVCTTVRNDQFRGLTELTVNRLMEAARDQVQLMQSVASGQQQLHEATQRSLDALSDNNGRLIDQQQEMLKASEEQRSAIETSLQDIMHDKSLIKAGQLELVEILASIKDKVNAGLFELDTHSRQTHTNHVQLQRDLARLDKHTAQLTERLDLATEHLLTHSEMASVQFDQTVSKMNEIRHTVIDVAQRMGGVQADLRHHFGWLAEHVSGTERFVLKLKLVLVYVVFVLGGMLLLVFMGASAFGRLAFVLGTAVGFVLNYSDVRETPLVQVIVGIGLVVMVNFIRQHLPASMSFQLQSKDTTDQLDTTDANDSTAVPKRTANATPLPPNGLDDTSHEYADRLYYQKRSTASFAYKTPATSRSDRSRTPSLLNMAATDDDDRFERDSTTRSRSGTPFSATSATSLRTRCVAITQKGDRCRLAAQTEGTRCSTHSRMLER